MKDKKLLVFLTVFFIAAILPWNDHPTRFRTEREVIVEICMKKVDVHRVYDLVSSTLPETPKSHRKLVAAILATEMANRTWLRRNIEYWIVRTWIDLGIFRNELLDRTLGLGQVSIRNALRFYYHIDYSNEKPPSSRNLQEVAISLMTEKENIRIVSAILINIENEIEDPILDKQKIKQVANKYNGNETITESLYSYVVLSLWEYLDESGEPVTGAVR